MKLSDQEIAQVQKQIDTALLEDIADGDITTNTLLEIDIITEARIVAREKGIIAGIQIAERIFKTLEPNIIWKPKIEDGDHVNAEDEIVKFSGSYRAILTGERTALNFLQRMSGIATVSAKYVMAVDGTDVEILDTRKTLPGFRLLDKYSVRAGGAVNHRIGLFDMVMIKDNHIDVAGSITKAVDAIKKKIKPGIKIEVETKNITEVKEALTAGADIIMLDNMSTDLMRECVKLINGRAKVEASGNINLERVVEVSQTGVDYISIGALTHSVKALDISQYVIKSEL
jgi:nicotinate-nucleotide pyrophosphorylase (carboxylating)